MSNYRIALAGQDITAKVDEPTIQIQNALAGGAGVMSHTSGRAGTCQFEAYIGPLATAPGAGQFIVPPLRNLLTANQSNVENGTTGFSSSGAGSVLSVDSSQAFGGTFSLKAVVDGTHNFAGWEIDIPGSQMLPNTVYTFSAYCYGDSGGKQLSLEAKQKESPFAFYSNTKFIGVNSWQRVETTFTTPATMPINVQLHLITEDPGGAFAVTFWSDNIQLEFGSGGTPWVVGGTEGLGTTLVRQGETIVYDQNNNRIFGGYLTLTDDRTKKLTVKTLCKAVDYWSHLDRVIVTKTYDGVSDTFALNDLISTYAPWIGLSNVNLSVSNVTLFQQVYRGKSLQSTLQHIADISGFDIWVDAYKNLYYQAPSKDGNAPFSISDSPDYITSFPAKISQHTLDDNGTINRVTFVGGSHPTTDFTQDISSQANGSNTTFKLAYAPHESSDGKIHVTVNAVEQAVGFALTTDQLKPSGTFDVLVDRSQATLTFATAPASGATVHCTYRYQTPLVVVVNNQASQGFFGQFFDGVISDTTVQDTTTALQRCRTLLAEQAQGLETLVFSTYQPGLQAGMRVLVKNAVRGINTTFRIQQVNTVWLGGGQFRYDVTAGAWSWHVADILLAAARFSSEADSNFDELNVSILAVQGNESVGLHDLWTVNPRVSGYYYARQSFVGDGHDALPGFFTVSSPLPAVVESTARMTANLLAGGGSVIANGRSYIIGSATTEGVGDVPAPSGHVV